MTTRPALPYGVLICAVALGASLALTSCTGQSQPDDDATKPWLDAAALAETCADEEQIALLADGIVTFEEYESAFGRFSACVTAAGGEMAGVTLVHAGGIERYDYRVGAPPSEGAGDADDTLSTIIDGCAPRHFNAVDAWWQTANPDAVAYKQRRAAALRTPLLDCLTEAGLRMPASATLDELVSAASNDAGERDQALSCLEKIGYDTWAG